VSTGALRYHCGDGFALNDWMRMADKQKPDEETVMELFGFKVKVSNPRLAEVLRMDAKEALTTDVRTLRGSTDRREQRAEFAQAIPDVVVAEPTPKDLRDLSHRAVLRGRADAVAGALGFDVAADGSWRSPLGVSIMTRIIDGVVSPATAADAISKLAPLFVPARTDESVLFIVEGEGSVTSYLLALRQQRAHAWARVIRMSDLESLRSLCTAGAVDHERAVGVLSSAMSADSGVIISALTDALSMPHND